MMTKEFRCPNWSHVLVMATVFTAYAAASISGAEPPMVAASLERVIPTNAEVTPAPEGYGPGDLGG